MLRSMVCWGALVACSATALQLFFVFKIALATIVDLQSTSFQRSQIWQQLRSDTPLIWKQQWKGYDDLSKHIKQAVIASEDADFIHHSGFEWDALKMAWQRNNRAQHLAQLRSSRTGKQMTAKVIGGSTISQQLAKNLFLSAERTYLRKAQEFLITFFLECLLTKERILEIYLNHVEWGAGVFGAQAASKHYWSKSANQLSAGEAARLAVMLPRPKFFEKRPQSVYLTSRSQAILARMADADLP